MNMRASDEHTWQNQLKIQWKRDWGKIKWLLFGYGSHGRLFQQSLFLVWAIGLLILVILSKSYSDKAISLKPIQENWDTSQINLINSQTNLTDYKEKSTQFEQTLSSIVQTIPVGYGNPAIMKHLDKGKQ